MYTPEEVKAAKELRPLFTDGNRKFITSEEAFNIGKILMWDEMWKQLEAKDKEMEEAIDKYINALGEVSALKLELHSLKASQEQPKEGVISKEGVDVGTLAESAYQKHSVKDDKLSLDEQIQRSGGFIVGFKEGYTQALTSHTKQGGGFNLEALISWIKKDKSRIEVSDILTQIEVIKRLSLPSQSPDKKEEEDPYKKIFGINASTTPPIDKGESEAVCKHCGCEKNKHTVLGMCLDRFKHFETN